MGVLEVKCENNVNIDIAYCSDTVYLLQRNLMVDSKRQRANFICYMQAGTDLSWVFLSLKKV